MKLVIRNLVLMTMVLAGEGALGAEGTSQNAALRYWMAFAVMENPPAAGDIAPRLARVSEGQAPWDEGLAAIVERNREALSIMHRGSRLPSCDWGYEYELLDAAPVANAPRARALSRLNVLYGMRLLHQGKSSEAVDAWLAGLRFSRHIGADGAWVHVLMAAASQRAHLAALTQAARDGRLDRAVQQRVAAALDVLPEDGVDWAIGARHEVEGVSGVLASLERAADPVAALREKDVALARTVEAALPQPPARETSRAAFRQARRLLDELKPAYVSAFETSPDRAQAAIHEADARGAQDPVLQNLVPTLARGNERRAELVKARADLLALVHAR
jgi:hypothetical protein